MKLNILSVDDSSSVLKYMEWAFHETSHTVTTVDSGKGALELFDKGKYDVIFLDWEMPVMSGLEVLEKIREIDTDIKIAMLTSKNDLEDISQALERGADDYIMKPFTPDLLMDKISDLFD